MSIMSQFLDLRSGFGALLLLFEVAVVGVVWPVYMFVADTNGHFVTRR